MVLLQDCEELVLHAILSKVGARHAAQLSCLCRSLRNAASDDAIWASFCRADFDVSTPHDPHGNPCASFKATYKAWQESFGVYPLPLVKRIKLCWDSIKNWTAVNFPEVTSTLQRGASEDQINEIEEILGLKFPLPTRIIYRFVNGQEIADFDSFHSEQSASLGLIGGYSFYDHAVNVHLLPLKEILRKTGQLSVLFDSTRKSKCIVVAASSNLNKFFFLDCSDGQMYVGTGKLAKGEMMPCTPSLLIRSINDAQEQDALLLWLEEYSRRLQNGMYKVRNEENIRSISLYPECLPLCSTAITNGVQVHASAIFVPEGSDLQSTRDKYLFSYSIRMRLLSQGNVLDGIYLNSCQLYWRHWIIRVNGTVVSDVSDKAVIGKYPLLYVDGEEFVYESCTRQPSSGSVEGAFTFFPGSLRNPQGRSFDVEVAQFPVNLPEYIF